MPFNVSVAAPLLQCIDGCSTFTGAMGICCGEDGGKKRAKALRVQKRSREAKRQAHDLWEKGDKAGAKTMSERGKELDAQAKKLHDQAAHAIYLHRNGGRQDTYIDLHGLFVEEALRFLKERLKTFAPGEKLEVVTGAGHHSEDHQARIKPAVIEYLGKKKLRWDLPFQIQRAMLRLRN